MPINNIKTFVVNLKKDTQKKEHMLELCRQYDLQIEFIEAVYGKELSENEVVKLYCEQSSVSNIGRGLARGEIGCALSHKLIYEKMLKENIPSACILEDDVNFDDGLLEVCRLENKFPKNWDLVLLGHHGESRDSKTRDSFWGKYSLNNSYTLVRPCEIGYGTYGYMISLSGAKKVLEHLNLIRLPIDSITGNDTLLNLYLIDPVIVNINTHLSDNFNAMEGRTELNPSLIEHPAEGSEVEAKYSWKRRAADSLGVYSLLEGIRLKYRKSSFRPIRRYK